MLTVRYSCITVCVTERRGWDWNKRSGGRLQRVHGRFYCRRFDVRKSICCLNNSDSTRQARGRLCRDNHHRHRHHPHHRPNSPRCCCCCWRLSRPINDWLWLSSLSCVGPTALCLIDTSYWRRCPARISIFSASVLCTCQKDVGTP